MKKTLRTGKKALSVFMAALMVLTAWVFFAPEKAEAATAGNYYVRVKWAVITSNNIKGDYGGFNKESNDSAGISIGYKDNNGTSSTTKYKDFDLKNGNNSGANGALNNKGDYEFTCALTGFPTILYAYLDDNAAAATKFRIYSLEVAPSSTGTFTTLWKGELQVCSNYNPYAASVALGGTTYEDYFHNDGNTYVSTSTNNWVAPKVNSIGAISGPASATMPKTGAGNSTLSYSATVYDQYGVSWYADPQFWVPITEPTSFDTAKKDVTTSGLSMSGTGVLTIKPEAQVAGDATSRTVWIACVAGTDKWQKKKITLNDPKYTVKFVDPAYSDPLQTGEYFYDVATPAAPTDFILPSAENDGHYIHDGWNPALKDRVTTDQTYTIKYKKVDHVWVTTSTIDSTCSAEGVNNQKCSVCGTTRGVVIEKKPHTWVKGTVHAPTCLVDGYTEYSCAKCPETKNDDVTTKLGHDVNEVSRTPATCQKAGVINYKCSRCSYSYSTPIPVTEHSYTKETITKTPTCEVNGHATYQCEWCGKYDPSKGESAGVDLPAIGHDWNSWTVEVPAECEKKGVEKRVCKNDASHVERRDIAQLNHDYDQTVTNTVHATCTKDGYTYHPCKHSGCDSRQTVQVLTKLGHDEVNGEWRVTKKEACETDGVREYYCGRCSQSIKSEVIVRTGHSFTNYSKSKDASCIENARQTASCDNGCGKTDTKDIPDTALGHEFLDENYEYNNDSKCEIDGTETAICTRCNATDTRTAVGTALKHIFTDYKKSKDATCLEKAQETAICNNGCGNTDTREIGEPLGHYCTSYTHDAGTETCIELGTKTGICTRCSMAYTVAEDRPEYRAPHAYELDADGNIVYKFVTGSETCTTDGIERAYCNNDETHDDGKNWSCKTYLERRAVGTRHPHSFPDKTEADKFFSNNDGTCQRDGTMSAYCTECNKAKVTYPEPDSKRDHYVANWISDGNATCTEDGTKHGTCAYGCGKEFKDVEDTGSALGHWFRDYVTDREPTCTEVGTRTAVCERCNATHTVTDTGSELGHDWSAWSFVGEKPNCEKGGTMERHCLRACCLDEAGNSTVTETKTVDALKHDYVWVVLEEKDEGGSQPSIDCTRGYKKHRVCSVCRKEEPNSTVEIEGGVHDFIEVSRTEPTCTETGERVVACSICGEIYSKETIPATGHIETYLDKNTVVAPTCKNKGYSGDTKCVTCNKLMKAGEELPMLNVHTFKEYVAYKEASCMNNRFEKSVCAVCGVAENSREVPGSALGHSFTNYVTENAATCTSDETRIAKCDRCDATDAIRIPNSALGHIWGDWVVVAEATCLKSGMKERACERDGCSLKYNKELHILRHVESEWIIDKESTCTEEGSRHTECLYGCGHIFKDESIAKKPHEFEISSCTATCIDDGVSYFSCTVCGLEKSGDIVKALGHDWGEWVVTKKPTCSRTGLETLTCARCARTKTRTVDALGHDKVIDPAVPATCTEPGLAEGSHCGRCGAVLKAQETVTTPHRDVDSNGKCDNCGKEINHEIDLNCGCRCHNAVGLMKIIYAIQRFFWKLFKINKTCACGAVHY